MKTLKRMALLLLGLVAAFSVIVYLRPSLFLAPIGRYIVVKDKEKKCDVIVILAGSVVDRTLAAADAYKKGLSDKIFMCRAKLSKDFFELKSRGVEFPEETDMARSILVQLDIPERAFSTTERFVDSTMEEAQVIRDYLVRNRFDSMLLVTSNYHSRRADNVFEKLLGPEGIEVVSYPSPYSRFDPNSWWQDRKAAQDLILEYEKIAAYLFAYGVL